MVSIMSAGCVCAILAALERHRVQLLEVAVLDGANAPLGVALLGPAQGPRQRILRSEADDRVAALAETHHQGPVRQAAELRARGSRVRQHGRTATEREVERVAAEFRPACQPHTRARTVGTHQEVGLDLRAVLELDPHTLIELGERAQPLVPLNVDAIEQRVPQRPARHDHAALANDRHPQELPKRARQNDGALEHSRLVRQQLLQRRERLAQRP